MSVYVDKLFDARAYGYDSGTGDKVQAARVGARNNHQWCHMWADTLDELHEMADKIGMKRAWFQNKSTLPHYDLVPSKRVLALCNGAKEKSLFDHFRERMAKNRACNRPRFVVSSKHAFKVNAVTTKANNENKR